MIRTTASRRGTFFILSNGLLAAGLLFSTATQSAQNSSKLTLVKPDEPGEPLEVSGNIYAPDGETPSAGVTLDIHQTGLDGNYQRNPLTRKARINGRLTTDSAGRYEFRTIKPGPYPGARNPAHIHFKAWGAGFPEQDLPDLLFEGDPHLPQGQRGQELRSGKFASICAPRREASGVLRCTLNFRLRR